MIRYVKIRLTGPNGIGSTKNFSNTEGFIRYIEVRYVEVILYQQL